MKKLRQLDVIRRLVFSMLLILPATLGAQQRPPIFEKVAKTYGLDSWDKIEAIRYTWNGEITGLFKASRKWEREPKTGKVTFEEKDKDGKPVKVTYTRSEINVVAEAAKKKLTRVLQHGSRVYPTVSPMTIIGCCFRFTHIGTPAPTLLIRA